MSAPAKPAADDRCAKSGCGLTREWHRVSNYGGHAFVEPKPAATVVAREVRAVQASPETIAAVGRLTSKWPASSTPDSSDDAAARAEAESIATRWVPAHMTARQGLVDDIAAALVRYRRLEREACVVVVRSHDCASATGCQYVSMVAAIARRGQP